MAEGAINCCPESWDRLRRGVLRAAGGILLGGLFLTYPSAILPPGVNVDSPVFRLVTPVVLLGLGVLLWWRGCRRWAILTAVVAIAVPFLPNAFAYQSDPFRLPTVLAAAAVGAVVAAWGRWRAPRWWVAAAAVYAVSVIVHVAVAPRTFPAGLVMLGHLTIPLLTALYVAEIDPDRRRLRTVAGVLGLYLILHGLGATMTGHDPVAITLNRNWQSAAVIALLPWSIWLVAGWLGDRRWLAVLVVGVSAAVVLWRCGSRASLVAVGAFLWLWLALWSRYRWWRLLVLVVGLAAIAAGVFLARDRLARAEAADVRLPLWQSTLQLIAAAPAGVGPGEYERRHVPYNRTSAIHDRLVASDRVEHPHSEVLYVAVTLGIPAALAWLLLLAPLLRSLHGSPPTVHLARFSAFTVVIHALLDKTLVREPSSLIGLAMLGVAWLGVVRVTPAAGPLLATARRRWATAVAALALVLLALPPVVRQSWGGWVQRRARQYLAHDDDGAALAAYRRLQRIQPRNPEAWYGAATVAIRYGDTWREGLEDLDKLAEFFPDYAHSNLLYGKVMLSIGRPADAANRCHRETQFYPARIEGWQWFYVALVQVGDWDSAIQVDARLRELYAAKAARLHDPAASQALADSWLEAVDRGDPAAAVAAASELTWKGARIGIVDPLFTEVTSAWPWALPGPDFQLADGSWWGRLRQRAGWVETDASLWDVCTWVEQHVKLRPGAPHDRLPWETVAAGGGSEFARYLVLAWLADSRGWDTLIYEADRTFALVWREDAWFEVVLGRPAGAPRRLAATPTNAARLAAELPDDFGLQARALVFPEACCLRQDALATALYQDAPGTPRFPRPPTAALARLERRFRQSGGGSLAAGHGDFRPANLVWTPAFAPPPEVTHD